jgi:predicted anti-sigma-YlaC factor YlaD
LPIFSKKIADLLKKINDIITFSAKSPSSLSHKTSIFRQIFLRIFFNHNIGPRSPVFHAFNLDVLSGPFANGARSKARFIRLSINKNPLETVATPEAERWTQV